MRITLRDPSGLVPGSADPLAPLEVLERPSRHGTLVVAKARLTPDMPYQLLTCALKETAFPRQSTGDQFFDHAQFDAHRALGFHIGTAALAAGRSASG